MELLSTTKQEAIRLIREQLRCSLCGQIFEDPQCLDCKHNFCRVCISIHLRRKDCSCPHCNVPTRPSEVTRNQFMQSILVAWKAVEQELAGLNKPDDDESDDGAAVTAREAERAMQNAANGLGPATPSGNKWNIDTQGILAEQKWYQAAGCTTLSPPRILSTGASAGTAIPLSTTSSSGSEQGSPTIPIIAPARIVPEINGNRLPAAKMRTPTSNAPSSAATYESQQLSQSNQSESPLSIMATQELEHFQARLKVQDDMLSRWEEGNARLRQMRISGTSPRQQQQPNGQPRPSGAAPATAREGTGWFARRVPRSQSSQSQFQQSEPQSQTQKADNAIVVNDDGDDDETQTQMPGMISPDLLSRKFAQNNAQLAKNKRPNSTNLSRQLADIRKTSAINSVSQVAVNPQMPRSPAAVRSPARKRARIVNGTANPQTKMHTSLASQEDSVLEMTQLTQAPQSAQEEYESKKLAPLHTNAVSSESEDMLRSLRSIPSHIPVVPPVAPPKSPAKTTRGITHRTSLAAAGQDLLRQLNASSPTSSRPPRASSSVAAVQPRQYVFVSTDLTPEETRKVMKACQTLGGRFGRDFDLVRDPTTGLRSSSVTHLITKAVHDDPNAITFTGLRCKRTAKYMRALAEGSYVVEISWIIDCLKAGRWLDEEKYEMVGDIYSDSVGKPRESRLRRTQTGRRNDIFDIFRFVLLSKETAFDFQLSSLRAVVQHFGGTAMFTPEYEKMDEARRSRRTAIGVVSKTATPAEAKQLWERYQMPVVRVTWIFDSISYLEVLPFDDYYPY